MSLDKIEKYYQILGINSKSTINEVKRAFRKKAFELHPDKNNSPHAGEQFILLTEAYEFVINHKTGKTIVQQETNSYTDWQKEERERARQKAREYAEMEFEKFKQTD